MQLWLVVKMIDYERNDRVLLSMQGHQLIVLLITLRVH